MSGGYASSGFEIANALDRRAFPTARRNRTGPPASTAAVAVADAAPAVATTRAFWFELRTNATSRTTIATPRLRGPVVVKHVTWGAGGGSAPDAAGWYLDVGKAQAPVAEVNVALTLARPWTSLFADMVPRSVNVPAGLTGMPSKNIFGTAGDDLWPINQLITDSDVFVVLSVLNTTAGARVTHGTLYLIEGLSLDQAALYL